MEYHVTGSTGNVYTVTYDSKDEQYSCTCPDFEHRCKDKNMMCKHIMKVKEIDDRYREELENSGIVLKGQEEIPRHEPEHEGEEPEPKKEEKELIKEFRVKLDEAKERIKNLALFLMTAYSYVEEK